MKVQLTFKSPDVIDCAIENLSEEEKEEAKEIIQKFVRDGEYIDVEIDTDLETCDVIPVNE